MESNIGIVRTNTLELADRQLARNNDFNQDVTTRTLEQTDAERLNVEKSLNAESNDQSLRINRELSEENTERNERELAAAIETVSAFIAPQIRNVNFTQDDTTGQRVIRIVDAESDELIKQFPSEEILDLASRIRGLQEEIVDRTGILIDDKV